MAFEHTVTVRFHEVDRAGIVFFGRAFEYCHIAFEELLTAALGHVAAGLERGGWGMPLVHAEADYRRPMRMGDRLAIALAVERVGRRSIAFAYAIRGPDGDLRATARLVHAFVDLDGFRPRDVPAELLQGLSRLGLWPHE